VVATLEDKIVQRANIAELKAIYEKGFLGIPSKARSARCAGRSSGSMTLLRQAGYIAAPAQYARREGGDQGGPYTAELEGQAGQAAADHDARWTAKFTKAKPREDGSSRPNT
jgi:hypothetical protein